MLELIDREIERVGTIVHQMYQLYGRAPQTPTEFNMAQTVREVLALSFRVAHKRGVLLESEVTEGVPRVRLPEGEVKQVLYNLTLNAIQASPSGAAVTVRITSDENEVVVAVSDRGSGIPEDVLPRIFDPFFSTKANEAHAGMGLGLPISQSVIEALGGRIDVASRVAQGSTFSAVFPARIEASQEDIREPNAERENPDR